MIHTTNLQRNNLQYLLTKHPSKTNKQEQQKKFPNKTVCILLQRYIAGTDVGTEEGLTFLP